MQPYSDSYFKNRLGEDSRRKNVWAEINSFFKKWYPSKIETAIELGAGYCFWINEVDANHKIAIDNSEIVRDFVAKSVEAVVADITDLSFLKNKSVDIVLASNLLEHLTSKDVDKTLREVFRALKDGGRFFIVQPNFTLAYKNYFDDYTHKTIFTHNGLCGQLKSSGFVIKKCWPRLLPFSFKSSGLPAPRLLVRTYLYSPIKPFAKQMAIIAEKPLVPTL